MSVAHQGHQGLAAQKQHSSRSQSITVRNKGKKKHATGTPDPPPTPSRSSSSENINAVLNNEEIQSLAVKEEDLARIREYKRAEDAELAGAGPTSAVYTVKKIVAQDKLQQPRQRVVVARPAPQNSQLKPIDYSGPSGPKYTADGRILEHTLLGSVHDFVDEAIRRNEMRPDSAAARSARANNSGGGEKLEVREYASHKPASRRSTDTIPTAMNQEKALLNWQRRMADRKRQQGHISNLLQKPLEELVMNRDDNHRSVEEKRNVIDRALAFVGPGKGQRVGSEFWNQYESFGDDVTGIKMSLTKTERGEPVVFEHVGKPSVVQREMGTRSSALGRKSTRSRARGWYSSEYWQHRQHQLGHIMRELDPTEPELHCLEVVGNEREGCLADSAQSPPSPNNDQENWPNNLLQEDVDRKITDDPLAKYPDVYPEPVTGPSIMFAGTCARWTGSSDEHEGKLGAVARVTFESPVGERAVSHLAVKNDGTTAIYYEWKKMAKPPAFDAIQRDPLQRFYFNTGEGVVLPGDTTNFPYHFKSPNAGIFTETWELCTKPVVMGGASLQVVLKGIATQEKGSRCAREQVENKLAARAARVAVERILDDILRGIRTPDRAPSPIDAYITEEEIFQRKNPGFFYDHEIVSELKNIYLQLYGEDEREGREWNLSLADLQQCVAFTVSDDDDEAKEELLSGLNGIIKRLAIPSTQPSVTRKYFAGYKLWQSTIDRMVSCSMNVRRIMGLPEVIFVDTSNDAEIAAQAPVPPPAPVKPDPKEDKKGGKGGKKGAKDDGKGKKGAPPGKKDSARPRSSGKGKPGASKPTGQTPTKDHASDRDASSKTPMSSTHKEDSLDPQTRKKYTEKMYTQVYELLLGMIDSMSAAFEECDQSETGAEL